MKITAVPITAKIVCLTLIFCTFLNLCLTDSELCHQEDKKALLQIKKAFNDPYALASWNAETDCCDWYGVKCNEQDRVYELYINDGELSGPIPPQVGDLPFLEHLQFHKNPNLTGPIQPAIAKLKRLRSLILTWNCISGHIPHFISDLRDLESFSLSFNSLTGEIPSFLGELPKLAGLSLDGNKLTGPIPDSFGKFKGDDFYLYLNNNQLSGKIPISLKKKDFSYIDLSRNKLEGDASILFGSKKSTWHLDLSRNSFQFDFSNVKLSKNLVYLDISHNKIFGRLPEKLITLSLQQFNVSYNRLCGKIPQGGDLQSFDKWAYHGNSCLCGPPLVTCDLVMAA